MNNIDSNYLEPSVRWTDKVTLCANGDIVEDFSGKVVGHVTPDVYEEITKNETLSMGFDYGDGSDYCVKTYKRFKEETDNEMS